MNKDDALAAMAVLAIIGLVIAVFTMLVVTLAPSVLLIFGAWDAFAFWYPIAVLIGRIALVIAIPISIYRLLITSNLSHLVSAILSLIMLVWGYPVFLDAVMRVGYSEVTGIEFQRLLLTIIFIESLTTTNSIITKKEDKQKEGS